MADSGLIYIALVKEYDDKEFAKFRDIGFVSPL